MVMLLAAYLKTLKKVDYLQNSKQKIEVQIYFNIKFLSNLILSESVCFAKTFCFIVFSLMKLNKHRF